MGADASLDCGGGALNKRAGSLGATDCEESYSKVS